MPGAHRVIDISGDGANNSGRPIAEVRDEAVAAGVTINGLPILWVEPGLAEHYRDEVIGGTRRLHDRHRRLRRLCGGHPAQAGERDRRRHTITLRGAALMRLKGTRTREALQDRWSVPASKPSSR